MEICDGCGREIEPKSVVKHRTVPEEVAELYGISGARTVTLCINCHDDLHDWYHKSVSTVTYDSGIKRFRAKTAIEMANEYESAFTAFVEYKKRRRKKAKRP